MSADILLSEKSRQALRLLGLSPGAGLKDLKKAYRSRLKATHPDVTGGNSAPVMAVISAYNLLIPLVIDREARRQQADLFAEPIAPVGENASTPHPAGGKTPPPPHHPDSPPGKLETFLSVYKLILKQYSRQFAGGEFLRNNEETRNRFEQAMHRLCRDFVTACGSYREFQLALSFWGDFLRFQLLPMKMEIRTREDRTAYLLYRKILKKMAWVLEETFSRPGRETRPSHLGMEYYRDLQNHLAELRATGREPYLELLAFIPEFAARLQRIAALLDRHTAVVPAGDYLFLYYQNPAGQGGFPGF